MLGSAPPLLGRVGGDCADEIQMTGIQEFTSFLDGDPLADGIISTVGSNFQF